MTEHGFRKLQDELRILISVERPSVVSEIVKARSYGDLSENAEYAAAKEKQSLLEQRIRYIEERISRAQVVDIRRLSGEHRVCFGAYVLLEDEEREVEYQIVGADEADIKQGKISLEAPLAKNLIGKVVGDTAVISIPNKERNFLIKAIRYTPHDGE